jgi:holo-[acyl-carrier protein] synthase
LPSGDLMIESVGIDLVETQRIKVAMDRYGERFTARVFTPWETEYCLSKINPALSFAGRFAVKEAVFKAIGTGFAQGVKWTSVEVVNDRGGQPQVRLGRGIKNHIGNRKIIISLSHTNEYAVASAILVSDNTD